MADFYSTNKSEVPDFPALITCDDIDKCTAPGTAPFQNARIGLVVLTKNKEEIYSIVGQDSEVALGMLAATLASIEHTARTIEMLKLSRERLLFALNESMDEMSFRRVLEMIDTETYFEDLVALGKLQGGEQDG